MGKVGAFCGLSILCEQEEIHYYNLYIRAGILQTRLCLK